MTRGGNRLVGLPALLTLAIVSGAACREAPQRLCAIDMGSNSFRRIVGTFADGNYTEFHIDSRTMGVGDDVERHGRISQDKLAEIRSALSEFKAACEADGAPSPVAVGTAAFRDAPNGDDAIAVAKASGVRMEIATEERESELAYLVGSLGRDGYAVIDNGSRSIELVAKTGGVYRHRVFNLGYRVAYQEFFAGATDPAQAIRAFRERLRTETSAASFMKGQSALAGVEFMEMAEILFTEVSDGHVFTLAQLKTRLDGIAASPPDFARLKTIEDIDRALPRLVVAVDMMEAFGYGEMSVTSRQLGAGLIIEAGLGGR